MRSLPLPSPPSPKKTYPGTMSGQSFPRPKLLARTDTQEKSTTADSLCRSKGRQDRGAVESQTQEVASKIARSFIYFSFSRLLTKPFWIRFPPTDCWPTQAIIWEMFRGDPFDPHSAMMRGLLTQQGVGIVWRGVTWGISDGRITQQT